MKRHIFTWISGGLLSLILIIFACTDEDHKTVVTQPTSKRTPAMVEIENFLKGQELCIPDISKSFPQTVATRSSMPTIQRPAEKLEPIWHTLKTCKGDQDNIRTVLLQADNPILGYIHEKNGGKSKQRMHNASFKLAVIKNKGTLVGRIITFIPDAKYKQDFTNNIIELGFNVNNTNYSGLQLVSTLDGVFLYGDRYDEGKPVYHFMPTATYKRHCLEHEHGHEHDSLPAPISPDKAHLFLRLHTFKSFASTRTDGYGFEETGDGETCSLCGKNVDECTCVTITAPIIVRCPVCGMDIKYCLCCQRCHQYPCICCTICWQYPCVCCPQCHRYPCTCLISGGGGGGGGNSGGGNNGGGSTPDIPDENTTPSEIIIPCDIEDIPPYKKGRSNCLDICKQILQKMLGDYTIAQTYQLYENVNGQSTLVGDANMAFALMNYQIISNKPFIIGVDYKDGSPNRDGLTDHFMIVNGRGYDETRQQHFFYYIETGRTEEQIREAICDKNRLYYDKDKGTFTGSKYWAAGQLKPTYKIVQIRAIK